MQLPAETEPGKGAKELGLGAAQGGGGDEGPEHQQASGVTVKATAATPPLCLRQSATAPGRLHLGEEEEEEEVNGGKAGE